MQVRIGSKKFTESVILGEVLRLLVENVGLEAVHYREFGGTRPVFDALVAGEIDAYPEYTGTILEEILARENLPDEKAMRDRLQTMGIGISQSLGFNNTYALALTRKRAAALGISRISDLKRLPELRIALTHEFLDRGDGCSRIDDEAEDNLVEIGLGGTPIVLVSDEKRMAAANPFDELVGASANRRDVVRIFRDLRPFVEMFWNDRRLEAGKSGQKVGRRL